MRALRARFRVRDTGPPDTALSGPAEALRAIDVVLDVALPAIVFVLLAHLARAMFPLMFLMGEDWSFVAVGVIALAVFAAPVLALPAVRLEAKTLLVLGGAAVTLARLAVQLVHPIPPALAMTTTGVGLIGAALVLAGLRPNGRQLTLGVVLGLAIDTATRAPFRTWDLVWQDETAALAISSLLIGAAIAVIVVAVARPARATTGVGPGIRLAALGPYLMLQLLFLSNLGFVGSQAGIGFAAATATVLGGQAAALAVLGLLSRPTVRRPILVVAAGVAAISPWAFTETEQPSALVAVMLLAQVSSTVCLDAALDDGKSPQSNRAVVTGMFGASLTFLALVLLWQLHIDTPLPFPRQALPVVAALAVGAMALRIHRAPAARSSGVPVAAASSIVVVALLLGAWLWIDRPKTAVEPLGREVLRVVQYNVRGAVGVDGMLDPDAVASAIASSNPDVVVLNEVARGWPVFGSGDLLARLQQLLDLPYVFEPAADRQFGNAILTRLPFTVVSRGRLPEVPGKQARSYVAVRLDIGSGRTVLVLGGHLEGDDVAQIEALLEVWGGAAPAVVAGDLNMQLDDATNVRRFGNAGLVDAEGTTGDPCQTTSSEPTSPCDRPDWVFVTPDLRITGFRIGSVTASDHLPIHVRLALPER